MSNRLSSVPFIRILATFLLLLLAGLNAPPAWAQRNDDTATMIQRMEELAREGRLPSYQDLRLPPGKRTEVLGRYMQSMPLMTDDLPTTGVVFAEVPQDSPYALMTLESLIAVALERNFDLITATRDLEISRSSTRSEEAFFVPFVDLVSGASYRSNENDEAASITRSDTTKRNTTTTSYAAGIEAGQNLPTGGRLTGSIDEGRSRVRVEDGDQNSVGSTWDAEADVRLAQPLLRGSGLLTGDGTDIGTADLRRQRLREMQEDLNFRIQRRDTIQAVIQQYFSILTARRQLLVSRDAIRERYRFLDETRIKYDIGRVAESEILRAEIQFLEEIERAINRQESLDNAHDQLLLTLGLPLDTPISLIDITDDLMAQGRVEIPPVNTAIEYALGQRREFMISDLNIEVNRIAHRVARNNLLPTLDFESGYSWAGADDHFREANRFGNDTFDAGLSLRIPLQNIQEREAYKRATLSLENSETDREFLERRLVREVMQSHRAVLTNEARLTVLRKRVEQARRNLELINESFNVGFSTITEVRIAQDDLFNAESAYSTAILSYQTNLADLYVSMGLPLY
ncbi:MAG: outer membrane protein [Candidatus Sumerlaeota bacterium]|nr:outer membrane protein [Candidatus Sumerlaeota bacterium]